MIQGEFLNHGQPANYCSVLLKVDDMHEHDSWPRVACWNSLDKFHPHNILDRLACFDWSNFTYTERKQSVTSRNCFGTKGNSMFAFWSNCESVGFLAVGKTRVFSFISKFVALYTTQHLDYRLMIASVSRLQDPFPVLGTWPWCHM